MAAGLRAVERAEGDALGFLRPEAVNFHSAPRIAWHVDAGHMAAARPLPDPLLRDLPVAEASTASRSRSTLVRLGKRPGRQYVRARAFLLDEKPALAMKVWKTGADHSLRRVNEGRREQRMRALAQVRGPYPVPRMIAAGTVGDVDYLLEPVVFGVMPRSPDERRTAAIDLVRQLSTAYRTSGVRDRRLSRVARPGFAADLEAAFADPTLPWPTGGRHRDRFVATVLRLVDRDLRLPTALGHGDLHMANVIRDVGGRHWLVDWEGGGILPVAFDLRRLLLTSGAPAYVAQRVADALRPFHGRGVRRYRWAHQLALGLCNELAVTARHREGARKAGRSEQFDVKLRTRLEWAMRFALD